MSRKLLPALAVFALLMQLTAVEAQTINEIRLNITSSGLVFVTESIGFMNNETHATLLLPVYRNLEVSSSGVILPYLNRSVDGGVEVEMDLDSLPQGLNLRNVSIRYETQFLTSKNGSMWSLSLATETTPRKTIVKLYLPTNSTILSMQPRDMFFSVDRDSLWLYPQDQYFNFTIEYMHAGEPVTPVPGGEPGVDLAWILAPSAAVLAFAAAVFYYFRKRVSSRIVGEIEVDKKVVSGEEPVHEVEAVKKSRGVERVEFEFRTDRNLPTVKSSVLNVLDEEEKNILSLVREHGPDDVTQAFIYKTTRMPKSSLSEIIKRLEKRNVIECHRKGRVNWISLKRWILE